MATRHIPAAWFLVLVPILAAAIPAAGGPVRYRATNLGTLANPAGVNELGQVVGRSEVSEGEYRPFLWDGRSMRER